MPPTMMPLVEGLVPVPGMMLPVVGSIFGALAATYRAGIEVVQDRRANRVGCPKNDQRTPMKRVRRGRHFEIVLRVGFVLPCPKIGRDVRGWHGERGYVAQQEIRP